MIRSASDEERKRFGGLRPKRTISHHSLIYQTEAERENSVVSCV